MKIRPLIIDQGSRSEIQRVCAHAEANPLSAIRIHRTLSGSSKPPGDDPRHTCVIPIGYRCVYSVDEQLAPLGKCRHLSVSVLGDGDAPNTAAVDMLMKEFGFRGTHVDAAKVGLCWPDRLDVANKIAVNVLEPVDVTSA